MIRRILAPALLLPLACATTHSSAANLPALAAVPHNVRLTTHLAEYAIEGQTVAELQQQIRRKGPTANGRHFAAVTRSSIKWTYEVLQQGPRCITRNATAVVEEHITLPAITDVIAHSTNVQQWWTAHRAELVDHEMGHVRIAANAGGDIVRELETLSATTCRALSQRAEGIASAINTRARQQQVAYDRDSNHGALPVKPL